MIVQAYFSATVLGCVDNMPDLTSATSLQQDDSETLSEHVMHAERYEVPAATATAIAAATYVFKSPWFNFCLVREFLNHEL